MSVLLLDQKNANHLQSKSGNESARRMALRQRRLNVTK